MGAVAEKGMSCIRLTGFYIRHTIGEIQRLAGRVGRALGKAQGRNRCKHVVYKGPTQLSLWGTGPLPSQPQWSMVQGTLGDLATMVSGATATCQILKIINREEISLGGEKPEP